jgi:Rrf2 family protein
VKISVKATYGIVAALDLAMQNGTVPVQAKSIARRQAIPLRFLEQVLHAMKQAGLIDSARGAQGGYLLGKLPKEISLADIVEALDGSLSSTVRHRAAQRREGTLSDSLLGGVWERVRQAELSVLNSVTLQDLTERYRQLDQERTLMYHI